MLMKLTLLVAASFLVVVPTAVFSQPLTVEFAPSAPESVDPSAAYEQASAILDGTSAEKDLSKARQLFQTAADHGNPNAKGALGFMLAEGKGGPKDEATAVAMMKAAAEAGIASAQMNYGQMLQKGRGIPSDWGAAHSWFEKAAAQNYIPARLELARRYVLREDGAAVNHAKALPHVRAAAEAGDAWAQNTIGVMLEFGQATAPDRVAALKWYRLSAQQGYARGQANAGRLLRAENPGDSETLEAYCWLKLAAEQGDATASDPLKDFESTLTDAQKGDVSQEIEKYRGIIHSKRKSPNNQ
jgi:TPR repeat protein